jgi:hypothetical protein
MGGTKTKTTQLDTMGPKSDNLLKLENSMYGAVNPIIDAYSAPIQSGGGIPQPYDNNTPQGQLFNDATKKTYQSNSRYDDLLGQSQGITNTMSGLLGQGANAVNKASAAGDQWYDMAGNAYGQAQSFIPQIQSQMDYASDTNKWYDVYTQNALSGAQNLVDTGNLPQPLLDSLQATVNQGLKKSMGTTLSDLAARGTLNSSTMNKGLMDMSQAAGDALNRGYLDAFNSALSGYQGNAATGASAGKTFADTNLSIAGGMNDTLANMIRLGDSYGNAGSQRVSDMLNTAQGYNNLGDSYGNAGSQRVSDMLNTAQGYNNLSDSYGGLLNANLSEREQLLNAIPQYYQNAAAPMSAPYDFLQTMLQDHWNSDKKDTLVEQKRPCFITTALCEYFDKPDNCYELTTLRHFRDMWLKFQPGGEELVKEYYEVAPGIVEWLNGLPAAEKDSVYVVIWNEYLSPTLRFIEAREYEQGKEKYIAMVDFLTERAERASAHKKGRE